MNEEPKPKQWPPPTLAEALRWFASDPSENAIMILSDHDATRVLIAFRNTEHRWKMPTKIAPDISSSLVAKWKWLTSPWRFDIAGLAVATGLAEETVEHKLDMLLANRLIMPDGTISKGAHTALQANANLKLGGKPARGGARPSPKKDETK